MREHAPKVDGRTAADLTRQVYNLLGVYAPEWQVRDGAAGGPAAALIGAFARLSELVVERLDRAPDKNLLAFLDLIGASPLPPQPARAPLTFYLAEGSTVDAVVPAGTQVAAPPSEGREEPVVFETERDLVVTASELGAVYTRDGSQDLYADLSVAAGADGLAPERPLFRGEHPIEHALYIGLGNLLGGQPPQELRLDFTLQEAIPNPDARALEWEVWDGASGVPVVVTSDDTGNITRSGSVTFADLPEIPLAAVRGLGSRWLRCRLRTPITLDSDPREGAVRASKLPRVQALGARARWDTGAGQPDTGFTNVLPLDLSKDFYPFGERPAFGDTLYVRADQALSTAGAQVTLEITASEPALRPAQPPLAVSVPSSDLRLEWELGNDTRWLPLGSAVPTEDRANTATGFQDTTRAFTRSGVVTFRVPDQPSPTTVNGEEGYWFRVRIVAGNYGVEARYTPQTVSNVVQYVLAPATFAPPSIRAVGARYTLERTTAPDTVLSGNDWEYRQHLPTDGDALEPFEPFRPSRDIRPTLYLGFDPAPGGELLGTTLSLYLRVADRLYSGNAGTPADRREAQPPRLDWEYWNGSDWRTLGVLDDTRALSASGLVEFLPPPDLAPSEEFGHAHHWVRARWESGHYRIEPSLRRVLPNTTMAVQAVTLTTAI